jgi:hypothetical protein
MDLRTLDRHRVILGWCFIAAGALGVLVAFIALVAIAGGGWLADDPEARRVTGLVGGAIALFFVLFSLPTIIAGFGLLKQRYWGKVLALIIGLLSVANVPIGTALFAYTLWFWLQGDSDTLFHRKGAPRLGPPPSSKPPEQPPLGPGSWPREQPT